MTHEYTSVSPLTHEHTSVSPLTHEHTYYLLSLIVYQMHFYRLNDTAKIIQ